MFMDFDEILHFLSSITLIRSVNWNPTFLQASQLVEIVFPFPAIVFVLALLTPSRGRQDGYMVTSQSASLTTLTRAVVA